MQNARRKRMNESDMEARIAQLDEAVTFLEKVSTILGREDEHELKQAVRAIAGKLLARMEEIPDELEAEAEARLERGEPQ